MCGGTIVATKYVVTAAHCTAGKRAEQLSVRMIIHFEHRLRIWLQIAIGAHDLAHVGTGRKPLARYIQIRSKVEHPRYKHAGGKGPFEPAYDSAVMELAEEIDLNTYTPACMARRIDDTTFDGKMATIAGWGIISSGREGAPDLTFTPYEVQVQVNTQEQCSAKVGGRAMLMHNRENHNNNMMCAGVNENGGRNLPASCRVNFSQYYTIQSQHFYCHFCNDEM